ncbi:MAG: MFS transporter, partial [Dehalococcoidia bacterium]
MRRVSLAGLVRGRVYYGWVVLAGSMAATAIGAGVSIWSFGLYVEPLEAEFGWSRAEVSAGFSISLAMAGIAGPLVGRWIDVSGPRVVILTGAIMTAATYALLALTSSLWQWFFFLSINAVFRQMMFFIPFMALISRWFAQKRGVALGILGAGSSMGAFVAVAVEAVISEFGWEGSFIFSAIVTVGFFVPISLFLIRDNPEDVGEFVDGEPQTDEDRESPPLLRGMTSREALRTPLFWFIAVAMTLFLFGVFGWIVHQVPFYESVGVSRSTAAQIVALTAGGGILSRLG